MPEERSVTTDQGENRLDRLSEDVAELKGEVRQMNQRIANLEQGQQQLRISLEQGQRWGVGLIL